MLLLVFTMFLPFSPSKESEFRTGRPGEATSVKTAYAAAGAEPVMEVSKVPRARPGTFGLDTGCSCRRGRDWFSVKCLGRCGTTLPAGAAGASTERKVFGRKTSCFS